MKKVLVFNGGRGASSLIRSLRQLGDIEIVSVVNAYDDGKSTGEVRSFFDMLGPSDIRKVQSLFIDDSNKDAKSIRDLYDYRYPEHSKRDLIINELRLFAQGEIDHICGISFESEYILSEIRNITLLFIQNLHEKEKQKGRLFNFNDCSIMNCLFAGKFSENKNLEDTSNYFMNIFKLQGKVLPNSNEVMTLVALRENGEVLTTEAQIVEFRSNVRIDRIYLVNSVLYEEDLVNLSIQEKKDLLEKKNNFVAINESVTNEIDSADIIIYSSGTQHSSLYPTYLTKGLAEKVANNKKAKKIFICNIGADYETPSYTAYDFFDRAYFYLNLPNAKNINYDLLFDTVLVNEPRSKESFYVESDLEKFLSFPALEVISEDFESFHEKGKHNGDLLLSKIFE